MRKIIAIIVAVAACGCLLTSCNEKPKSYRFVKVMDDGKEEVQDIKATNDTDALKQYLNAMEKVIIDNIDNPDAKPFKAMFVISPDGDTLNTNNALLETVVKDQAGVTTIQPGTVPANAVKSGTKLVPLEKQGPANQPAPAK